MPKPTKTWVQVEKAAMREWGMLISRSPIAARLMMELVQIMNDETNAVVCSRETMARMLGVSRSTIWRALKDLQAARFVELVRIGNIHAIAINARVAWSRRRTDMPDIAIFSARVIASREENRDLDTTPLKKVPTVMRDEEIIPVDSESGEQMYIPGTEPPGIAVNTEPNTEPKDVSDG